MTVNFSNPTIDPAVAAFPIEAFEREPSQGVGPGPVSVEVIVAQGSVDTSVVGTGIVDDPGDCGCGC